MGQILYFNQSSNVEQAPASWLDFTEIAAIRRKLDWAINDLGNCIKVCAATIDQLADSPTKSALREKVEGLRCQLLIASLEVTRLYVFQRDMERAHRPEPLSQTAAF